MFVPRPQTTHVPRHYTARKTGNKDKENAGALPTKTPSRGVGGAGKMLVPNTTRVGLGAKAGDGKGKGKEVDDIGPKRLFTSTSNLVSSKSFGNLLPIKQASSNSNTNTKTPARQTLRTPAPAPAPVFQATPLPSASKPRRSRRSGSASTSTSTSIPGGLTLPLTPGPRQWDEGESLGSISEGLNELALGTGSMLDEVVEEEEDGEPEYMPPRSIPLPFEPLGAVPGVEAELKAIISMPVLWMMLPQYGEMGPPPPPAIVQEEEQAWLNELDVKDRDELEEPMFRIKVNKAATVPGSVSKVSSTKPRLQAGRPAVSRLGATPGNTSQSRVQIGSGLAVPSTSAAPSASKRSGTTARTPVHASSTAVSRNSMPIRPVSTARNPIPARIGSAAQAIRPSVSSQASAPPSVPVAISGPSELEFDMPELESEPELALHIDFDINFDTPPVHP